MAKFRCPKQNQELAVTGGWRAKQEEELIALQKLSGAAGSALCLTMDNLRATMEDMVAMMYDFKEGKFEDPSNEAEKILGNLIRLLCTRQGVNIFSCFRAAKSLRINHIVNCQRPPDDKSPGLHST